MKRAIFGLVALFVFGLVGCGTDKPENLDGVWSTEGFEAEILNGQIEIAIVTDTTAAVYWVGSAPDGAFAEEFISTADRKAMGNSMLASRSDTKQFTFEDGEIVFEFKAMGTTSTIELSRK